MVGNQTLKNKILILILIKYLLKLVGSGLAPAVGIKIYFVAYYYLYLLEVTKINTTMTLLSACLSDNQ